MSKEIQVVSTNGCPFAKDCGVVKFLANKGKIENGMVNCGKENPNECARNPINPRSWVKLSEQPRTFEELEVVFPNGRYG